MNKILSHFVSFMTENFCFTKLLQLPTIDHFLFKRFWYDFSFLCRRARPRLSHPPVHPRAEQINWFESSTSGSGSSSGNEIQRQKHFLWRRPHSRRTGKKTSTTNLIFIFFIFWTTCSGSCDPKVPPKFHPVGFKF